MTIQSTQTTVGSYCTHTLLMLLEYKGITLDLLSSKFVTHRSALALRTTCKKRKLHVPACKLISMDTPN